MVNFNDEQLVAVKYRDKKNCIVNAGPGSGKTTSMVGRIVSLLEEGVNPRKLFISTFTKDAAETMTKRVSRLVDKSVAKQIRIGTTHSLFYRILRDLREYNGLRQPLKIITGGRQYGFFLDLIKEHDLNCKAPMYYTENISALKNRNIDAVKNLMTLQQEPTLKRSTYKDNNKLAVGFAYIEYEKFKKKEKLVDFDDMLCLTLEMLKNPDNEEFLVKLRKSIDYIMVDEAQDLNSTQYELVELISNGTNLMLILDDFQAIYGWRGSHISLLFQFIEKYKPNIINVTTNHRSPKEHVRCANALISHNTKQISKSLKPYDDRSCKPQVIHSIDIEDEAQVVFEKIEYLLEAGYKFSDICILYRTNAQSRALMDIFESYEIPVEVSGGYSFYDRADVKDIIAYLKIIVRDDADFEDFKRIANKPNRYISTSILNKADDYAFKNDISFYEALRAYPDYYPHVKWGVKKGLDQFITTIFEVKKEYHYRKLNTSELLKLIVSRFGYEKAASNQSDTTDDSSLNIESLISGSTRFQNPDEFIAYAEKKRIKVKDSEKIQMMTVHASKGLEFPIVFVIGMCDKIMPYYRSSTTEEREEERRVAYVAVTRSQNLLYLSAITGYFGRMKVVPSPYIGEMGINLSEHYFVRPQS
jgi:DNA helicase II / ATP-dependent DNA helicase PcrA